MARTSRAARVEVRGAKELRAAFIAAGGRLRDLTDLHKRAAEPVREKAVDDAPRDTGALAGSHKVYATKQQARLQAGSAVVPYAGPIHFGWPSHGIEPQPWLWGAMDAKEQAVVDVYEREVEDIVHDIDKVS